MMPPGYLSRGPPGGSIPSTDSPGTGSPAGGLTDGDGSPPLVYSLMLLDLKD